MRFTLPAHVFKGRVLIIQLLAFLAGVLAHFSFAPYHHQWLAPLAIMGLFALLHRRENTTPKHHALTGLSFGFGLFIAGLRWVHVSLDNYGGLPLFVTIGLMVLLALYLALYPALACFLFGRFKLTNPLFNTILFSSAWLITEYLRGFAFTGFPWLSLGYSQTQGLFSAAASVIGMIGLSGLLCLLATLSYYALNKHWLSLFGVICLVIAGQHIRSDALVTIPDRTAKVALVQGNIAQSAKWESHTMWPTITDYMDSTRQHFDSDIIIWPEAAIPAIEDWVSDYLTIMDSSASFNHSAIVTGIISRVNATDIAETNTTALPTEPQYKFYNSIITLGNASTHTQLTGIYRENHSNRYSKHQLLPIGEFVPFEALLRPLAPLFNLPMSSFSRGAWGQENLVARGFTLAPAICYEIAFSELVRANMQPDTNFLLTLSNDAWFGRSIGPHQHMQIAQMRAIELGRPLIRVSNSGITAVVNTDGKITQQLPQFETGVLRAELALISGLTFFYRHGEFPIIAGFFILLMAAVFSSYYLQRTTRRHN